MKTCADSRKPELMSPAGHWPQLKAAISAGADAVYFGLQHFSARAKVGFRLDELPDVMKTLHRHAVKGFVTFNTLVFDHELPLAAKTIEAIAGAGADAIIVQDIGIAKLARQIAPGLEVHGSTQMSITSAEGAELAATMGCSRVVLGRELSIADIRRIAKATNVELEVFVHGALCVSYSGQCFSSEAWGGRSANRGQCAQACRLSYDLIVDGNKKELGEYRYLLSPGDLYALDQIPELIETGIACLKIEGRYKGPEYVALTTKAYRDAIDQCFDKSSEEKHRVTKDDLEQVYSRGLGAHFVSGTNHQQVVVGRAPRHRGIKVGIVDQVEKSSVILRTYFEVKPGDGLVFDSADWRSPDEHEEGGHVYEIEKLDNDLVRFRFGHGEVSFSRIRTGDLVWRTGDTDVLKKGKRLASLEPRTTGLRFVVNASLGQPLEILAESEDGYSASFSSEQELTAATSQPMDRTLLKNQLSRLGNTPFHFLEVQFNSNNDVFCPVSVLNNARRKIVKQLTQLREAKSQSSLNANTIDLKSYLTVRSNSCAQSDSSDPELHVLVRNAEQLDAAIQSNPHSITLDYLDLYGLRPSVEKITQAGIIARVASPRVLKPSEQKIVRFLLSLDCQILIRSGGLLYDLVNNDEFIDKLPELFGDFSLNASNSFTFQQFIEMGLTRIAPTHDLNSQQICELVKHVRKDSIEMIAFHHLPVFHTEHCVFCRFLSSGTDNTNCGHPCEKHNVSIQDSNGRQHAVLADVGCRNTVFGAEVQFSGKAIQNWIDVGYKHFRVEFVNQSAQDVLEVCQAFSSFLNRESNLRKFESEVSKHVEQGVTEGSLFVPKNFKSLVQLS